jgi:hypothetical protein
MTRSRKLREATGAVSSPAVPEPRSPEGAPGAATTPELSLILPCRNEEEVLGSTLEVVDRFLARRGHSYEILVSDDSSTDGTAGVAAEYARRNLGVRVVPAAAERGKGAALSRGFAAAHGQWAAFLDADLEIPVENLSSLLKALEEGADIAIGSKRIGSDSKRRSSIRRLITAGYAAWVRIWLGSRLSDHQAGAKALRLDRCRSVLERIRSTGWSWDTEMLVYAQQEGLRITECPITTRPTNRASRVHVLRDPLRMAWEVVRLRTRGVRVGPTARTG